MTKRKLLLIAGTAAILSLGACGDSTHQPLDKAHVEPGSDTGKSARSRRQLGKPRSTFEATRPRRRAHSDRPRQRRGHGSPRWRGPQGRCPHVQAALSPNANLWSVLPTIRLDDEAHRHRLAKARIEWFNRERDEAIDFVQAPIDSSSVELRPTAPLDFWSGHELRLQWPASGALRSCPTQRWQFAPIRPQRRAPALPPSAAHHLAEHEGTLYSTSPSHSALQIYAATELPSSAPTTVPLPGPAYDLSVQGERLYLAAGLAGVWLLEPHSAQPAPVRTIALPGFASSVTAATVNGQVGFAAALGSEGFAWVEPRDAASFDVYSHREPPIADRLEVVDVSVRALRLATADNENGTSLYDIGDVRHPVLLDHSPQLRPFKVALSDTHLYVLYAGSHARVVSFSLDDLSTPVDRWEGCGPCENQGATDLFFGEDHLLISLRQGGVQRLELTQSGRILAERPPLRSGDSAQSVVGTEDAVWVGGVRGIVGFDNAQRIVRDTSAPAAGDAQQVAVHADTAYVANSFRGLQWFDLTDPLVPQIAGEVSTPGRFTAGDLAATSVALRDGLGFIGDGRAGLSGFSVPTAANPVLQPLLSEGVDAIGALALHGDAAFACNGNRGLEVFDGLSAASPRHLAALPFPPDARHSCQALAIDAEHELLYVGDRDRLSRVDISTPADPTWLEAVRLDGDPRVIDLAVGPQQLWLTTRLPGPGPASQLQLFDLEGRQPPVPRWTSPIGSVKGSLLWVSPFLLVAADRQLEFYRGDTFPPRYLGQVSTQSSIRAMAATQQAIYLAESTSGLTTIDYGQFEWLTAPSTTTRSGF